MKQIPAPEEEWLSDAEIEAILAEENFAAPETDQPAPQHQLAQSGLSKPSWGKWLMMVMFVCEFIMFMTKR